LKAIPTWKQRKLQDVLTVNSGSDYKHLETGEIPVYGTGGYMLSVNDNLSKSDSIGIGRKGTIDKPQYLKAPFWTVDTLFFMTPFKNFDINFLFALSQKINWKRMDQSTGVPSLSKVVIEKTMEYFPSLGEQQSIGFLFRQFDKAITLHQEKLSKLQSLKEAALQSLFPQKNEKEPKVRFANFKEIWKQYKLKDVIESELKGKAKAKDKTNDCKNVYLETNYLNGGEVSYVDVPNDVDEDDVLILWDGSQAGTVYHGYKGALGSTLKAYKPKESGEFMFQYLKKNQQKIYDNYRTPNIPHVVKTFTEDFRIKSTSIIEQRKISSFFKQLDSTINFYQDKLEKLQLLKKAFLQKMFI